MFCVAATVLGKYIDLLNDVSTANYERAVTCDVAKLFFSGIKLVKNENLASLDASLLDAVRSFVSAAADEEEAVLKLVALLLSSVGFLVCHDCCSVVSWLLR